MGTNEDLSFFSMENSEIEEPNYTSKMAADSRPKRNGRRNRGKRRKPRKNKNIFSLSSEIATNLKLRKELLAKKIDEERMLNIAMKTAKEANKKCFDVRFEKPLSGEKDEKNEEGEEKKAYLNQDTTAKENYE